ncbi:MAG: DUF2784 domain-containing protein [Nitrospiraceae bacterium]
MLYTVLADLVALSHLAFVLFVIGGGLLVLRWPRAAWFHLPAAAWGAIVEFTGWICPLTPVENWLRVRGGETGYEQDFLSHYLLPLLYPAGLTSEMQYTLGLVVLVVNGAMYGWLGFRTRTTRP